MNRLVDARLCVASLVPVFGNNPVTVVSLVPKNIQRGFVACKKISALERGISVFIPLVNLAL